MKALILATFVMASTAMAGPPLELERPLTVTNGTRAPVTKLFAATAKYDGRDAPGTLVVGDLKLAPGTSTVVKVKMARGECMFHLRAETAAGDVRAYNVDICSRNAKVTLSTAQ